MYYLQLGPDWWVEINYGDLFVYKYDENHFGIKHVDQKIDMDEYLVEILSFKTQKHYVLRRDNGYFWWEEIKF